MIRLILQVFCAIFSGIIEATAISNEILPFGSPFLALFCLVPLYLAVARAKSYRESFWLFFIQTSVAIINLSEGSNFLSTLRFIWQRVCRLDIVSGRTKIAYKINFKLF